MILGFCARYDCVWCECAVLSVEVVVPVVFERSNVPYTIG